ncbi:hypothetical protein CcCBS67573_g08735 [Chytriomyces confervae]|uniref:ER membrane protein complex subunit 3 n=1 Tax=Chytriomyces confervae TaxID=246404 RepID=A0A507EIG3_9FUNG|nr:hypothetical protein CcCBS67573_g08735 [Chytriomyces confervae]
MYLDPSIRDWVLMPIIAAMILVGILRHCATQLINTIPKSPLKDIRQGRTLTRSRQLRFTIDIPEHVFETRCQFLMDAFEKNECLKNPDAATGTPNPMQDPAAMNNTVEGRKHNMLMFVPQTIIMTWTTFFFSGFILS